MIDAGTLQVKVVDGRMVVALATDILFAAGSATLSADGQSAVEQVASVLAGIPDRNYQVAGHTDDRPIANEKPSRPTGIWELDGPFQSPSCLSKPACLHIVCLAGVFW